MGDFEYIGCYGSLSLIMFKQIKFMKDLKKGKAVSKNHSRGVAFVEFSEHQHALVALRVLNNNPGIYFIRTVIMTISNCGRGGCSEFLVIIVGPLLLLLLFLFFEW